MKLNTFIVAALLSMCSSYAFAQTANFTKIADKKTSVKIAGKQSKYVVSHEEAAKMRLDAAREIEVGW
ncbi:MAG TPA: hypothetical protein VK308_06695, partial [Pyrinomonadaceae bacterium]|nr:hypothetical protein [Pyrinomonadaceae bacterium]